MKNKPKPENKNSETNKGNSSSVLPILNSISKEDLLVLKPSHEIEAIAEAQDHKLGENIICRTDSRPRKRSPIELVLDATEGFIPLWEENQVLRWEFDERSFAFYQNAQELKAWIRNLLSQAIAAWGNAAPIRFTENPDNSDFAIVMQQNDNCSPQGCTLAQAFFPNSGRNTLYIFPQMFSQSDKEQIDTLTHELGHVFGLRHFFAPTNETQWPSVIFGENNPFSIMNYGNLSELTDADRRDLQLLYENVWSGNLRNINGTPIRLMRPFHAS